MKRTAFRFKSLPLTPVTQLLSHIGSGFRLGIIDRITTPIGLPGQCSLCHNPLNRGDYWICNSCDHYLPYSIPSSITHTTCKTCGEALPASVTRQQCGQCLKQPPAIDWLRSCFDYQYPINDWLPRLKFGKHFALADWLAHKWWQHWTQGLNQGALQHMDQEFQIIPVPLHSQRLRQRGYNQSLLIAQRLAKQLKLPLNMHCVKRHKKTQAQSGLSLKQRQRNIKQAFTVTTKPPSKVILVDDVFTTGSTINELAQTLKSAGSLYIEAWVIAHAPLHHQQ